MPRKLTITLDDQVYDGLYRAAGRGHISRFVETVVRPHVLGQDLQSLEEGYRRMAADEAREAEALNWAEATIREVQSSQAHNEF